MTIILRIASILTSLFLVAIVSFTGCMTFRDSDQKIERYFEKKDQEVDIRHIPNGSGQIRFVETANAHKDSLPLIVFVHGAPGSAKDFQKYLTDSTLLAHARMITLDRLGYGYSNYGKSEPSIAKQAAAVKNVTDQFHAKELILVGHSYGGPIVGKFAMDYPEQVDVIMMLAPVIDPDSEKIFWYANFAKWGTTRWMLSKALRVSGDEKFAHPNEIRKIADDWDEINIPVIHIHGMRDKQLAPAKGNIAFSKAHINPDLLQLIVLEKTGHLIPWTDYDVVKEELLKLLKK